MFAVPVAVGRQGALNSEDIQKLIDTCAVDRIRAEDALAFTKGDFNLAMERLMAKADKEKADKEKAMAAESTPCVSVSETPDEFRL